MVGTKAYLRLYEVLREKIFSGEYGVGDQIPTEREIEELFGVSRITIRHALRLLQEQGLVERRPGKGTFVRASRPLKVPILNVDYTGSMRREAPNVRRELVAWRRQAPPEEMREVFGTLKSEQCTYAVRLDVLDGEPMAYDMLYILDDFSGALSEELLVRVDFLQAWMKEEEISSYRLWESIEAVSAGAEAARLLHVPRRSPLLLTSDILYVEQSRPIAVFDTLYRGDRFKLIATGNMTAQASEAQQWQR
jgi:GntR family transcriptional regulator